MTRTLCFIFYGLQNESCRLYSDLKIKMFQRRTAQNEKKFIMIHIFNTCGCKVTETSIAHQIFSSNGAQKERHKIDIFSQVQKLTAILKLLLTT